MHVAMRTITAITIFWGLVGTAFSFCSMKLGKFTFIAFHSLTILPFIRVVKVNLVNG